MAAVGCWPGTIDGIPVGPARECDADGWQTGGVVVAIQSLWPEGHPPIDRVCYHTRTVPDGAVDLGGGTVFVFHLADGTRRAYSQGGVGCGLGVPPEAGACPTYSPPAGDG